jgi:hypothetical protein
VRHGCQNIKRKEKNKGRVEMNEEYLGGTVTPLKLASFGCNEDITRYNSIIIVVRVGVTLTML